jgi:hypothetical protein
MRPSKAVKKFGGLSQERTASAVPMDEALDLMNVFCSSAGYLEKMRVPLPLTAPIPQTGNAGWFDYQRADGIRQIIVCLGTQIWKFEGDQLIPTLIDDRADNQAEWSFAESNNLLFMANGIRMLKWTGAALQNWGIDKPVSAPVAGLSLAILTMARATNVVTVTISAPDPNHHFFLSPKVGDTLVIAGCSDTSFNGNFKVVTTTGGVTLTFAQTGPNATPAVKGTVTLYSAIVDGTIAGSMFAISTVTRLNNVASYETANNFIIKPGDVITVAGCADVSFNGIFPVVAAGGGTYGIDPVQVAQVGPDVVTVSPGAGAGIKMGMVNAIGGRTWRYAGKNSITKHIGTASDAFGPIPNSAGILSNAITWLTPAPFSDPQVDTIVWYASLDGGGEHFLHSEVPLSSFGGMLEDHKSDTGLNTTIRAQLINNVPPIGTFLMKFQARIFIAGIVNAPQDIAYSGYERILTGRPEESFPQNNRLRLSVGADDVRGMGAIHQGLVAWSHTNEMFILRGTVEDIVTDAPVAFSAFLDGLPWDMGANSHYSIVSTPHGVVWDASDNTVQIWYGAPGAYGVVAGPHDLSDNIVPLLRRVSDASKEFIKAEGVNYLDREWYVLLLPVDGAVTPNRIVFIDLTPGEENAGCFVSDIQAEAVLVHEDSRGGNHLLILQQGVIKELTFNSIGVNGIIFKKGLDVLPALVMSTLNGPANPIPLGNYYMRVVKISYQGGETAQSAELGPFSNGGTKTVVFTGLPTDANVWRWRVYFGLQSGNLNQYVDTDAATAILSGIAVTGAPLVGSAPLQRRLPAFWRGGWYGNDNPDVVKMFRDGHLVTSQTGFSLSVFLVDDENYTFDKPNLLENLEIRYGSKYSVNQKSRRMSPLIQFPDADFPATVLELSASFNEGGQR